MKQHSVLISDSSFPSNFEFSQGEVPDSRLTPGVAGCCDPVEVLRPGYAKAHRRMSEASSAGRKVRVWGECGGPSTSGHEHPLRSG